MRRAWGPEDFSAFCEALARHPATQGKNALQEAVELEYATTEDAAPCPVIDLGAYRARRR